MTDKQTNHKLEKHTFISKIECAIEETETEAKTKYKDAHTFSIEAIKYTPLYLFRQTITFQVQIAPTMSTTAT